MNQTAFSTHRQALLRTAYRMLGSMADAEDILQEAWLRWDSADRAGVENPGAYLRRIVTRLCLDQLDSARARREDYFGPWLPEPVVEPEPADDISLLLMLALERLSPLERAAFLLHDVFGEDFDAIAATIGRDAGACRQLAARARKNVQAERKRFPLAREHGFELAAAFAAASQSQDIAAFAALLARDVKFHSDGGGKRPAVGRVLSGIAEVLRALAVISRLNGPRAAPLRYAYINGLPGYVTREKDGFLQTTAFLIDAGKIAAIYVMRNPDKLRGVEATLH